MAAQNLEQQEPESETPREYGLTNELETNQRPRLHKYVSKSSPRGQKPTQPQGEKGETFTLEKKEDRIHINEKTIKKTKEAQRWGS